MNGDQSMLSRRKMVRVGTSLLAGSALMAIGAPVRLGGRRK